LWTEDKFEEFAEKRAEQILTKLTKYTAWKNNEGITGVTVAQPPFFKNKIVNYKKTTSFKAI
jgi:phosphoserine aminotransferase